MQPAEPPEEKTASVVDAMPAYDYQSVSKPQLLGKRDALPSYYMRQLSARSQQIYNEIYAGAMAHQKQVVLSQAVPQMVVEKIMHILFLDSPELFMLEPSFECRKNSQGNVESVRLEYNCTKAQQQKAAALFQAALSDVLMAWTDKTTENDVEKSVLEKMSGLEFGKFRENRSDPALPQSASAYDSAYTALTGRKDVSSLGISKAMVYLLRQSGVDAAVVVGEFVNPAYLKSGGYPVSDFKGADGVARRKLKEKNTVHVTYNYSFLYAWTTIRLNENWYHVDPVFCKVAQNNVRDLDGMNLPDNPLCGLPLPLTINVDDYTISQSRMFHISEDLLGVVPACLKHDYQVLYQSGDAVVNYTASQIPIKIESLLEDLVENKTPARVLQFCSEQTYNDFLNQFESSLNAFNKDRKDPIRSWQMLTNRQGLAVILYNFVYF